MGTSCSIYKTLILCNLAQETWKTRLGLNTSINTVVERFSNVWRESIGPDLAVSENKGTCGDRRRFRTTWQWKARKCHTWTLILGILKKNRKSRIHKKNSIFHSFSSICNFGRNNVWNFSRQFNFSLGREAVSLSGNANLPWPPPKYAEEATEIILRES